MLESFEEFFNKETEVNESLNSIYNMAVKTVERGGGNPVNLTDYGLKDVAGLIDDTYNEDGRKVYTKKTERLFRDLLASMTDDEIKNNQWQE